MDVQTATMTISKLRSAWSDPQGGSAAQSDTYLAAIWKYIAELDNFRRWQTQNNHDIDNTEGNQSFIWRSCEDTVVHHHSILFEEAMALMTKGLMQFHRTPEDKDKWGDSLRKAKECMDKVSIFYGMTDLIIANETIEILTKMFTVIVDYASHVKETEVSSRIEHLKKDLETFPIVGVGLKLHRFARDFTRHVALHLCNDLIRMHTTDEDNPRYDVAAQLCKALGADNLKRAEQFERLATVVCHPDHVTDFMGALQLCRTKYDANPSASIPRPSSPKGFASLLTTYDDSTKSKTAKERGVATETEQKSPRRSIAPTEICP